MPGPLTPPVGSRFSTGQDLADLVGPSSAPPGAVSVTAGTGFNLNTITQANPPGTTFYLLAGTHVLGGSSPSAFDQIVPKAGNTYIGAPGAKLDGRSVNQYSFTGSAANVTIKFLEITGFACPFDEFVGNHNAADGWTWQGCNFHDNGGASVGIGTDTTIQSCYFHDCRQYAFSSYKDPVDGGDTPSITNVLVDKVEITGCGDLDDEFDPITGEPTYNGRNGGCKFWDTEGIVFTNSWIHSNPLVAIWADTNNIQMRVENNLIEENGGEGFFYEISYNFLVKDNTFRHCQLRSVAKGVAGNNFPYPALYLSESGGDAAVGNGTYAISEVVGNTFIDNYCDLTLWENADRFCNSPANTSSKIYKPLAHGATLALCNNPSPKTLTVTLTSGSPNFTVTGGTFEFEDEGRPVSGTGIPGGAKIGEPLTPGSGTSANGQRGYIDSTHGRLTANATSSGSVTMTVAAGDIDDTGYAACRWHTANVWIHDNTFHHDPTVVLGGQTLAPGIHSGKIGIISNYGTYPAWSPYTAFSVGDALALNQDNLWENNTYVGDYHWVARNGDNELTFSEWQASPYNQDAGSTLDGVGSPGGGGGGGSGSGDVLATYTRINGESVEIVGINYLSNGSPAAIEGRWT